MKSKIELRQFAANLAAHVVGVTANNIIDVAKELEAYVLGGAELPETEESVNIEKWAETIAKIATMNNTAYCEAATASDETAEAAVAETEPAHEEHAEPEPAQAAPVAETPVADVQDVQQA